MYISFRVIVHYTKTSREKTNYPFSQNISRNFVHAFRFNPRYALPCLCVPLFHSAACMMGTLREGVDVVFTLILSEPSEYASLGPGWGKGGGHVG
jgi:hypothetical protein